MGRPSKLTDVQWAQIEKRLMSGESASSLALEFGVNRAAVSRRLSQHIATVKTVANQIVEADAAFRALPVRDANDGETVLCFRSYLPAPLREI